MAKKTAVKAPPDLLNLANEKHPSTVSHVKLSDLEQARAAMVSARQLLPADRHLSLGARHLSAVDLDVPDSDMADFLATVGASLFARASSRVLSRNIASLLEISDQGVLTPVNSNVHHLLSHPSFNAEITVPRHMVIKSRVHPRTNKVKRGSGIAKSVLMVEKQENAEKLRQQARKHQRDRVLTRFHEVSSLSVELKREKRLMLQTLLVRKCLGDNMMAVKAEVSIVVVGAGLAGISAADQLLSFGFTNVVVLEALDRIGGRIHSVPYNCQQLEMGVSCLDHANKDNSVYSLVKLLGLPEEPWTEDETENMLFSNNGMLMKAGVLCQLLPKDSHLIYSHIKSHHCENVRLAYADYIHERFRRVAAAHNSNFSTSRLARVCQMTNSLNVCTKYTLKGDSTSDLAINLLGVHQDNGGARIALPMGMSTLLTALTARLKSDKLKLRACVQSIQWRVSRRKKEQTNCQIACSDGRLFYAHHVIVAIPLGHLKENFDKMFQPSLPTHKSCAIKRLGFGTVAKVYLCYKYQFWSKPFSFIWPGTESATNKILSQTLRVRSLNCHPKTVEVLTLGDVSERMIDSDVSQQVTAILRLYFRADIPPPIQLHKSEWYSNFLFRGTHPYLSTQCSESDVSILREPLMCGDIPVVMFAGDYTHNNYSCLTHAARVSGIREAHRLHNLYNINHGFENTNF